MSDSLKKKELLDISEISVNMKSYEDIFSSFDPRPYSKRALSDDFLAESKKFTKETSKGAIELNLLMPKEKRDYTNEALIKRRLKEYFKNHYSMMQKDKKKIIQKGLWFTFTGIILMFVGAFFLFKLADKNLFYAFLVVLLEPAGWFLFWEGLDLIIFDSRKSWPDLEFYRKMSSCNINFHGY